MKNSTTRNINELMQHSTLTHIVQRANELNILNSKIQKLLPNLYNGLYRVRNLSDNSLTFEVQSAAVRQGLLFQQTILLNLIRQDYPNIDELKFKVNPNFIHSQ